MPYPPSDIPEIKQAEDGTITVVECCPECGQLVFETHQGKSGMSEECHAEAFFVPDGYIAVFDEEQL